jgi:hypothetical protein
MNVYGFLIPQDRGLLSIILKLIYKCFWVEICPKYEDENIIVKAFGRKGRVVKSIPGHEERGEVELELDAVALPQLDQHFRRPRLGLDGGRRIAVVDLATRDQVQKRSC